MEHPTDFLSDPNEDRWDKKLHLGCGGIYLIGYDNIDITGTLRAGTNWEPNATSIDNYYARLEGDFGKLPLRRENVVDAIANLVDPPYPAASVDKIVCIQALEHLAPRDVDLALSRWWNILRPSGIVVISVPRMDDVLDWLNGNNKRDFAIRHLQGSRRDMWNYHRSWYNPHDLEYLFEEHGYKDLELLPNFHLYPAIVLKARKHDSFVPDRSYQALPYWDDAFKSVLDVGAGKFPFAKATHCFDVSQQYWAYRRVPCDLGNVEALPYESGGYDYVYCSHVLEHVEHPAQALAELQRVGKRGFVEVPSAMLDWFMQHGRAHPGASGKLGRWMCLQIPNGIVFVERDNALLGGFTDEEFGKWVHRVTQYQIPLTPPEQYMRQFFWDHQHILNVSAAWNEERRARAIEIRLDGTTQ